VPDSTLRFVLRSGRTLLRQQLELCEVAADGSEGGVIATARLGMMGDHAGTIFYADPERTRPMFRFSGDVMRERLEVVDDTGAVLGSFRKDWKASVLRSTWHLETATGLTAVGRERSRVAAVARRFVDDIPFVVVHFDFVTSDGHTVLSSVRRRTLRAQYELSVPVLSDGRQLDWRVAAAVGVALETVQLR
jgi:hypothetical protein